MTLNLHQLSTTIVKEEDRLLMWTEQIIYLREIGFTWNEVSTMLGISRMTWYRKRKKAIIADNNRYCTIPGPEQANFGWSGQKGAEGMLHRKSIVHPTS